MILESKQNKINALLQGKLQEQTPSHSTAAQLTGHPYLARGG